MVYVDDALIPYRGMLMSHMAADSREELMAIAARIGVSSRWLQAAGTPREHFDVCRAKRELALALGARAVTRRELVRIMVERGRRGAKAHIA